MGAVRLLLAIAVVVGHTAAFGRIPAAEGWCGLQPLNPFYAVQAFFTISGFYMALVLSEKYQTQEGGTRLFYFSRYFRLMPTYWLVALTTALVAIYSHNAWFVPCLLGPKHWDYGFQDLVNYLLILVSNVTLLGQDLATFLHLFERTGDQFVVVSQAWSVSTELVFYLMAPFLVRRRTVWLLALAAASVAVRCVVWNREPLESCWQQKFFPSDLYFFVLGILAYRFYQVCRKIKRIDYSIAPRLTAAAVLFAFSAFVGYVWPSFVKGVMVRDSIILGLAIFVLLPFAFHGTRHSAADKFLGDLSYPLYMWHICVITTVPADVPSGGGWLYLLLSLLISYATVRFLERPVERWRQQ